MTYSVINSGSPTEAFSYDDTSALTNINSVLSELADNTVNAITPHDLRDLAYTVWQNSIFKPTINSSNIQYIGIDQNNLYEKIFLGKKQVSGLDVLTTGLLTSDIDHFIYNTKTDALLNSQDTKIAFLAGASPSIFYYGNTVSVPYIGAKVVTNLYGNVLDLNIINNSYVLGGATSYGGNINVLSKYGNVLINGLIFPTYLQNVPGIVPDNSILTYKNIGGNAYLQWNSNTPYIPGITVSGTFSINAGSVYINGFNTVFSDTRATTTTIGSIPIGSSFSNIPLIEVIRMILYPYVPPRLTLSPSSNVMEVDIAGSIGLSYTITKVTASSSITNIISSPLFLSGLVTSSIIATLNAASSINATYTDSATYSSISYYSTPGPKGFTLSVTDNIGGTVSANCIVNAVYPIFYGTAFTHSSVQSVVQSMLSSFTKIVDNNINKTVPISGTGVCIYYCVPNVYNTGATVSSVFDTSNPTVNIRNNFRGNGLSFTMSFNSPSGFWSSVLYNCYIYSPTGTASTTSLGIYPYYATNYQFNF